MEEMSAAALTLATTCHLLVEQHLDDCRVVGRVELWQHSQVHSDRRVGRSKQRARLLNLAPQRLGIRLRQRRNDTDGAGIRHGGREGRVAHIVHATLNDRVLDAEALRELGGERHVCWKRVAQ